MAGAADKKQAQRNRETLKSLHTFSGIVNVLVLLFFFILKRPTTGVIYWLIFSTPAFIFEYIVESIGRPTYSINEKGYEILDRPGDDLQQEGLTEYMFDIIYLTLIIDILMCVLGTMKVWWLLFAIPAFAMYKLSWLWKRFLPSLKGNKGGPSAEEAEQKIGSGGKSKRQQKMEKRAQKQQQQVRYR
ncbi:Snd2 protein [Martiniozyma asiatica (nom. inval.)]|nr:Snd2 protein [Martiniozyma asiatica]